MPSPVVERLLLGRWRHVVLFMVLSLLYLATFGPYTMNDTLASSAAAWNIATNGTLDFAPVGFDFMFHADRAVDGSLLTNRFPGTFLVAVPVYWILPKTLVSDGDINAIPYLTAEVLSAFLVAGAVVVLVQVLRELVEPELALGVGVVVGLGTPVWSVASSGLWTHTITLLMLALAMKAIAREEWWWAGAALGWAVFARPTFAIVAAVVGVSLAWSRRSAAVLFGIGVPAASGALALSAYSRHYFGTWLPAAGYDVTRVSSIVGLDPALLGGNSWASQLVGTFFDLDHGVFPYSVFLLPLLVTVPAGWRKSPDWVRACVLAAGAYWLFQLRGNRFSGGAAFLGYRFPLDPLWLMTPMFALGFREWSARSTLFRRVVLATAAISIAWMVTLAIVHPDGTRPGPDAVEALAPTMDELEIPARVMVRWTGVRLL